MKTRIKTISLTLSSLLTINAFANDDLKSVDNTTPSLNQKRDFYIKDSKGKRKLKSKAELNNGQIKKMRPGAHDVLEIKNGKFESFSNVTFIEPEKGDLIIPQRNDQDSLNQKDSKFKITSKEQLPSGISKLLVKIKRPQGLMKAQDIFAEGVIGRRSKKSMKSSRNEALLKKKQKYQELFSNLELNLKEVNANIIEKYQNIGSILVEIDKENVEQLISNKLIQSVFLPQPIKNEHITGEAIYEGLQINQFTEIGSHQGWISSSPTNRARIAQVELGHVDPDGHVGFFNGAENTTSRVTGQLNCATSTCFETTSNARVNLHATQVAGILIGDLTDGQDANITNDLQRLLHSSTATEALLEGYAAGGSSNGFVRAVNHIVNNANQFDAVNVSMGTINNECAGRDDMSLAANEIYEAGVPIFAAIGNDGNSDTTECTADSPASALGTFAVGSHTNSALDDVDDVRFGNISTLSSRGGVGMNAVDGGGRTITDISAPGCRSLTYTLNGGYSIAGGCGTSFSTPTVTSAAMNLKNWYLNNFGPLIEEPGILYAMLLNFGDGEGIKNTSSRYSGFNNLWGSGRLQMRRFDQFGMDSPWRARVGWQCVGHGETIRIDLMSRRHDDDVDTVKVAAWWYDDEHGTGSDAPSVYLTIEGRKYNGNTPGAWSNYVTDYNYYGERENKGKVVLHRRFSSNDQFLDDVDLRIKLGGIAVYTDDPVCGNNATRVYYSAFYEDADRDSSTIHHEVLSETP